jgi:Cu+-exporting ATPase
MTVAADPHKHVRHRGTDYYFCSTRCVSRFSVAPEQFVAGASAPPAAITPQVHAAGTIYVCPMHPEVRQDHPGDCPKCGMALEPEMPGLEDEENPELRAFERRFWWTLPMTAGVFVLAM